MRSTFLPLLLGLAIIPACRPAVTVPAAAPKAEPGVAFDRLLGLMQSRLVLMHDVARRKWADRSPIEDPGREATLLGDIADRGERPGPRPVRDPRVLRGADRGREDRATSRLPPMGGRTSRAGRRGARPRPRPQAQDRRPEPRPPRRAGPGPAPLARGQGGRGPTPRSGRPDPDRRGDRCRRTRRGDPAARSTFGDEFSRHHVSGYCAPSSRRVSSSRT